MPKIIITYNEVIDLNHIIAAENLSFKIHLHDACGSQSFSIEALGNNSQEQYEALKRKINQYFEKKGIIIRYSENDQEFVVNQ
ncbi:MAG: hypothetical protein PHF63_14040 [Herbinix sp.]|nr:hypothetical protein [Herbinix sp.]